MDGTLGPQGSPSTAGGAPVLRARNISKSYGRVVALRGVDLDVYPGEILGLVGDNGAGKSTLIKCITGAETPDGGTIFLEGSEVAFHSPLALPIILVSHNMPVLWELANRVQVLRLGRTVAIVTPETHSMEDAVALMTGAKAVPGAA
jgi:ABC-type sugar transport system ATPase subunit